MTTLARPLKTDPITLKNWADTDIGANSRAVFDVAHDNCRC